MIQNYEFDIVLDIARNHVATASKDTTFLDQYGAVITPDLGKQLKEWLDNGVEPERCEECGGIIKATKTKSVDDVIQGTMSKTGKKICMKCYSKWIKENEVKAVSE